MDKDAVAAVLAETFPLRLLPARKSVRVEAAVRDVESRFLAQVVAPPIP